MQFLLSLFISYPYFDTSLDALGWLGLIALGFVLVFSFIRMNDNRALRHPRDWLLVIGLFAMTVITTLFIGFRFPTQDYAGVIDLSLLYQPAAVMIFSAIPIFLAGGLLGPRYTFFLAALSGFLMGLVETHSLFTILEYAGLGLTFSYLSRQRYFPRIFSLLRHPLAAGIVAPLLFIPFFLLSFFFSAPGAVATRLDFALRQSWLVVVARLVEYVAAGLIVEIIFLSKIKNWGSEKSLQPLPWENRLAAKYVIALLPIFSITFLALFVGDWLAAGRASRKLIEDRLGNLSSIAAESLPYFLETGQNLILSYSDDDLAGRDHGQVQTSLSDWVEAVPFFTSLVLLDSDGNRIAGFPEKQLSLNSTESEAIELAQSGLSVQTVTVGRSEQKNSAQIAFFARLESIDGQLEAILIGYTDLQTNPFTRPAIEAIHAIEESGGEGWILDEDSLVIYHSDSEKVLDRYFGSFQGSMAFYEQTNPEEAPRFLYVMPVSGRPWTVVLSIPTAQVHQLSLDIAVPLLVVLSIISIAVIILVWVMTDRITRSFHDLAQKATLIARGDLNQTLRIAGADEVGQLAEAIDQMRLGLIARIEDINNLLWVSQGATSSLDAEGAVIPILHAFVKKSACFARALLFEPEPWLLPPRRLIRLGVGKRSQEYSGLDEAILDLVLKQKNLVIENGYRCKALPREMPLPGAVLAYALRDENQMYGIIWAGFTSPQRFSDQDLQYFSALTGQATLSVGNANLFRLTEIGRQRLEAILNASPDPILVFDQNLQLQLLNSAAKELPNLIYNDLNAAPLEEVLAHKSLLDMISRIHQDETITREIVMPGGHTFMASVAAISSGGNEVGKICMLRDISRYKELDTLKSEFVSTVSHDLKQPLTLLRGYSMMLEMLGELNPQQKSYSQKIVESIEQMAHLVDDILDLTRIESGVGLNISTVNIIELVEKIVELEEPLAKQRNVQLILSESVDVRVSMRTDYSLVKQALLNLVDNAIKFSSTGGQVEISTQISESNVLFEIKDYGMGISTLDIPYIFDKFFRSENNDGFQKKSSGLGLAIVKSIANRLGGKVWVQSKLGKGSTFFLEIPLDFKDQKNSNQN